MLDTPLRPLKDHLFNPLCTHIPNSITPLHLTLLAFISGLISCVSAATDHCLASVIFWISNRIFDCLDGGVARVRSQQSDLGGFLDLLGDFIVYSGIPIACGLSREAQQGYGSGKGTTGVGSDKDGDDQVGLWLAIAVVEASFHVNNFVLFYVGAVVEKRRGLVALAKARERSERDNGSMTGRLLEDRVKELTSVAMRPALVEGVESAIMFTMMLACPALTKWVCWLMAGLVGVGICQRVVWIVPVLK